jgi:bifunctional ADP-heptose synthase (sugar kinase/adenylyltransferase)
MPESNAMNLYRECLVVLNDLPGRTVHVIGDAIRDVYTEMICLGKASKSATLVLRPVGKCEEWDGGATVVARHCEAAGAIVTLTTTNVATRKERILVDGTKVWEVHQPIPLPLSQESIAELLQRAEQPHDILICADFQHGIFTPQTIQGIRERRWSQTLVAADSQTTDICWGNILDFSWGDLLFANERELRFAYRDQVTPILDFVPPQGPAALFLKRGADGLYIFSEQRRVKLGPLASQPIVDPIGAGDALMAYATLAYHATKDLMIAGMLGSFAAAECCAHQGNVPVTPDAIRERLERGL